tara:strand:- start:951 stop:1295 length:345 start_codon:yes stop_codon:yes gene_type:complete
MVLSINDNNSNLYHIIYKFYDKMGLFSTDNNVYILSNLSNKIELLNETFIEINTNSNQFFDEQVIITQTLESNLDILSEADNELIDIKSKIDFKNLYIRLQNYEYFDVNMDDIV